MILRRARMLLARWRKENEEGLAERLEKLV